MKFLAVIVFAVTILLIVLNAYQREQVENDLADSDMQTNLGPGATQAAELSFPTKNPTLQRAAYYEPQIQQQQQQQYTMIPVQSVRPGEPALQYMAVPMDDGHGGITHKIKRVVSR